MRRCVPCLAMLAVGLLAPHTGRTQDHVLTRGLYLRPVPSQARPHRGELPAGTVACVVASDTVNRYVRVVTSAGQEGWVLASGLGPPHTTGPRYLLQRDGERWTCAPPRPTSAAKPETVTVRLPPERRGSFQLGWARFVDIPDPMLWGAFAVAVVAVVVVAARAPRMVQRLVDELRASASRVSRRLAIALLVAGALAGLSAAIPVSILFGSRLPDDRQVATGRRDTVVVRDTVRLPASAGAPPGRARVDTVIRTVRDTVHDTTVVRDTVTTGSGAPSWLIPALAAVVLALLGVAVGAGIGRQRLDRVLGRDRPTLASPSPTSALPAAAAAGAATSGAPEVGEAERVGAPVTHAPELTSRVAALPASPAPVAGNGAAPGSRLSPYDLAIVRYARSLSRRESPTEAAATVDPLVADVAEFVVDEFRDFGTDPTRVRRILDELEQYGSAGGPPEIRRLVDALQGHARYIRPPESSDRPAT